ncbi:MAG: NAD(P)/FAD-dependent oxidoreductase [Firmicutes bacterium]|nr:NAD(P)/FAD-dependent oxidoreductase [Bacillota bacterium]
MAEKRVAIIGGGAAGLMAALVARRFGAQVTLLEKNPRVGKKLLATGNGRCNFTNMDLDLGHFHGTRPPFAQGALSQLTGAQTLAFFRDLGIEPREEEAGKIFPASGQASSVLDVLRYQVEHEGVEVVCDATAKSLIKNGDEFTIHTSAGTFNAQAVVIATGGKAGPQFGSTGDGYNLAISFGHRLVEPFPALVQLRLKAPFLKGIAGVKFVGQASIHQGHLLINQAEGEILFTNYGISGPPILALSRTAGEIQAQHKEALLKVSLLPNQQTTDVAQYLERRFREQGTKTAEFSLVGFINKRLIPVLLKEANIELKEKAARINTIQTAALAKLLTAWTFTITGTNGWTAAQVTAGGLDVRDIDSQTLGSRLVPGLYFAGEIIDIDGDCGGYNLQWAWSSGFTAGLSAALYAT